MLIAAARVITAQVRHGAQAILAPGYVRCENGSITSVGAGPPPDRPDVDLADGLLLPGFVDLQINGCFGVEFGAAQARDWAMVARRLPETGTTAFMPTFVTRPVAQLADALRRAAGFIGDLAGAPGLARVLGIHVEGPFISKERAGAHNTDWIVPPTPADVAALLQAGSGQVRIVTLAPEADGAMAAIGQLRQAGVVVSVGHSDATAHQVSAAALAGATMVTHLFNAQRPMHHREPGVVAARRSRRCQPAR